MSIIEEKQRTKEMKNNILTLSRIAANAKREDNSVINATIGMFFDKNNEFKTFNSVDNIINNLSDYDSFSYLETTGGVDYENAIKKWIFSDFLTEIEEKNYIRVCATPGGTGAIALSMANYIKPGDYVLIPNKRWEPYYQFCFDRGYNSVDYNLYNEKGEFDLDDVIAKSHDILTKQSKLYLIINDPCHNPTGFCMNESDYDGLIDFIKKISVNHEVVLLIDIAYLDYSEDVGNSVRSYYKKFKDFNENVMVQFAFSASKTFGLYGLRVGALVCLTSSEDEARYFIKASEYTGRTTWSNVSHLGVEIVKRLVDDKKFNSEIKEAQNVLAERSRIFKEEAKKYNLNVSEYRNGFFACIYSNKDIDLQEEFKKRKVYTTPTKGGVRIALSCITNEETARICEIASEILN